MINQLRELIIILEEIQEENEYAQSELGKIISVFDKIEKSHDEQDANFVLSCLITAVCLEERILYVNNTRLDSFLTQLNEELKLSKTPVRLPVIIYEIFKNKQISKPIPLPPQQSSSPSKK